MLKNKNCQWGKKTKFIFLTPFFFFFTNSLHVGTFPRKRHLYHFLNVSKGVCTILEYFHILGFLFGYVCKMKISWKLYFQLLIQLVLFVLKRSRLPSWRVFITVQVKQHVGLQQVFGSVHLALGHVCTQRHPKGNRGLVAHLSAQQKAQ